jgi:hypothetical protein
MWAISPKGFNLQYAMWKIPEMHYEFIEIVVRCCFCASARHEESLAYFVTIESAAGNIDKCYSGS